MSVSHPFRIVSLTASGKLVSDSLVEDDGARPADWIVICDEGTRLVADFQAIMVRACWERPDVDLFYGDEAIASTSDHPHFEMILKTSFDKYQLVAQDYIGLPLIVRGTVFRELASFSANFGEAFSYSIIFRAVAAGFKCERIVKQLSSRIHRVPLRNIDDRRRVVNYWIENSSPHFKLMPGRLDGTLRLQRMFDYFPHVSIIIPTRQALCMVGSAMDIGRPLILNLLESLTRSSWPFEKLTVIIGDDADDTSIYDKKSWPFKLCTVRTHRNNDEPFNYSQKMNSLIQHSDSDFIILLNDDIVAPNGDWIEALMSFAMEHDVGGVGARLLFPNNTIQHAGMAGGVLGGVTHLFINTPASAPTYSNWANIHRECSMVTGAVFATRKSIYDQMGAFDENLALEFNDVDLCLRMISLGYKILYTPFAELTHHESASRQNTLRSGSEVALFIERWQSFLIDDPFFHPRFAKDTSIPTPIHWN